ncbi:MAG TPA: acetyl-CoA carboxylase carboxyl transferase subunit alpha [Candidatus Dormibacteraeota bacterium]|jgi:acetyl-CoA carboxylase carboxyl transferase alpha subunit|nr:acetyl-CoA carboxylase carboxyl transferase subunit alpha [Candidatus Dormibacteraeota bacterium]
MRAWDTVQLARHEDRPYALDYVDRIFDDFVELHGDRAGADDRAVIGGPARLMGRPVMLLAHQKGRSVEDRLHRNYGMAGPAGYRKALRLMRQAERFDMPVLALIDTPGAYPGVDAEKFGQAWVISECLTLMSELRVPIVSAVIGEGGSGGALALALADRLLMLENAIYTVASPEACAAITWRDPGARETAAAELRLTSRDALDLGVCDEVIAEHRPAHDDAGSAAIALGEALGRHLDELSAYGVDRLLGARYWRFRRQNASADLPA